MSTIAAVNQSTTGEAGGAAAPAGGRAGRSPREVAKVERRFNVNSLQMPLARFLWLPARRPTSGGQEEGGRSPVHAMMKAAHETLGIRGGAFSAEARLAVLSAELRLINP
jgi:hypothetical protein